MKKLFKILLWSFLALIVLSTFIFLWNKSRPQIKEYEIVTPALEDIMIKTVATGKVEPRDEILIKPRMSGIISEVYKEAGQEVKEGEVIAKIRVIPEMVQLNSAESRVRMAEISFKQIKQSFNRDEELYKKGIIAKAEFEQSEATYKKNAEELENAKDALSIIREGISQKSSSSSTTHVRSTISGTILDIPIKAGNSVIQANTFNDGTTIASVADMSNLIFRGTVDETEVGKLTINSPIKIKIGALTNQTFDASLEYIAPKGKETNGAILFEIKAAIKIPKEVIIRAGYSANAEIILQKELQTLSIPEKCVTFANDSAFVYVAKKQTSPQEFEKKHIEIGISDGINVEVKSGLEKDTPIRGSIIDQKK